MSKEKEDRKKKLEDSDDSDSSGPTDRTPTPVAKKAKTDSSSSSKKGNKDEPETKWDLGKQKTVTVRTFKGTVYVDIREFYEDKNTGEMKPGKKGISLSAIQWQKLKSIVDEVDEAVKNQ